MRTPQGRYGGALAGVRPDDLAALVVGEAVRRAGVPADAVDEVVLGAANQAGEDNRNVARMAALLAGLPETTPGYTVNRLCASGLTAVASAAQAVRCGEADVVVAGGVESMTRAPWVMAKPGTPWARPGEVVDSSLGWRFTNPVLAAADPPVTLSMGETAEEVAALDGITRADSDAFALRSHQRAVAATDAGRFAAELRAGADPGRRRDRRRGPAPVHHLGEAGRPQAGVPVRRHRHRRLVLAAVRRRRRARGGQRRGGAPARADPAGPGGRQRQRRRVAAADGPRPGAGDREAARPDRL